MKKFSKCQSAFLFSIAILLSVAAVGCDYQLELVPSCGKNEVYNIVTETCDCKEGYLDCTVPNCNEDNCRVCAEKNSIEHCGTCGNSCAIIEEKGIIGSECINDNNNYMCKYTCGNDKEYCNGMCVDIQTDIDNCGECDNSCYDNKDQHIVDRSCKAGICVYMCGGGEVLCGNACVNVSEDNNNCGSCDNKCKSNETCFEGSCALVCNDHNDCEKYEYDYKYTDKYLKGKMKCTNKHCVIFDKEESHNNIQIKNLPSGEYRLEVWGASGGEMNNNFSGISQGGVGGYSAGNLTWKGANLINKELYINIGKIGGECSDTNSQYTSCGGNNGGGSGYYFEKLSGYGGGGATDIRIDGYTLYHRVIVAGGGGGADIYRNESGEEDKDGSGGYGGGELAGNGLCAGNASADIAGADQKGDEALFGKGENVVDAWKAVGGTGTGSWKAIGGGGGGWYGGRAANDDNCGGAGGSGFVFTSLDQKAVSDLNGKYMLGEKYLLKNARTVGGKDEFPSTDGKMERGHKGNGAVRITLLKAY